MKIMHHFSNLETFGNLGTFRNERFPTETWDLFEFSMTLLGTFPNFWRFLILKAPLVVYNITEHRYLVASINNTFIKSLLPPHCVYWIQLGPHTVLTPTWFSTVYQTCISDLYIISAIRYSCNKCRATPVDKTKMWLKWKI